MTGSEGRARDQRGGRRWPRRLAVAVLALGLLIPAALFAASAAYAARDDRRARMRTDGPYTATVDTLQRHPVPAWFADAKFGIFVHWGLFSVPGFAPTGRYADVLRDDYDHAMTRSPYAEDYWNALKDPGSPTAAYHRQRYGDLPYEGFQDAFERQVADWDADAWAETFQRAGARYVVMVAKYHDGYALWPTRVRNPHKPGWFSRRDLVGELAAAVRARGMRFGIYYSGGVDWTFQPAPVFTLGDYSYLPYGRGYADYADAQVRELIDRYRPDILWNDISWPTGRARLHALFADYYNTVPDGVVNDRWQTDTLFRRAMGSRPARAAFDLLMRQVIARDPDFIDNVRPPAVPHADFTTPEYTQYAVTQDDTWETTRGIGNSYGYNRNETDAHYASFVRTLLPDFVDAVAKNGNLLLNVGPSGGNGAIPAAQRRRLDAFGSWLRTNGAVVYGARPHRDPQGATTTGLRVRALRSGDDDLAVVVLGTPSGRRLTVTGLDLPTARATLLADGSPVQVTRHGDRSDLVFARDLRGLTAPAIRFGSAGG